MVTEFIDNWLHPLADSSSDIGLNWYLASKVCGDATGRREACAERQASCRDRVRQYLKVTDGFLDAAKNNEDLYASLVSRYAQKHTDDLTEVLGDRWNIE